MLECDVCGATENGKGKPFRSEQGLLGHKQFAHERAESCSVFARQQVPIMRSGFSATYGNQQGSGAAKATTEEEVDYRELVAPAIDNEAEVRQRLKSLEQERDALAKECADLRDETARVKADAETRVQAAQVQLHPYGLCQETSCESCVAQGQEIANAAYARGREDLMTYMDESPGCR